MPRTDWYRGTVELFAAMERGLDEQTVVVKCTHLTRRFGDSTAVNDISFSVQAGQIYGFLGTNGAGKSTTIKMLTGLLVPSEGRIEIFGEEFSPTSAHLKARIGVVPESMALLSRLTGAEYLEFVGGMYRLDRDTVSRRTEELLSFFDLPIKAKKLIQDYSHGMKKKLAFAAAVMHGPSLLFLDEPFEGVDAVAARAMKNLLQTMIHRATTVFITSHVLEIVERLCTEIAIIHNGELLAVGSMTDLHSGSGFRKRVPTEPEAGGVSPATLEQLFLNIVGHHGSHADLSWL